MPRRSDDGALKAIGVRDVARAAGVSPITVSRMLRRPEMVSAKTRERVQRAIDELGFIPNSLAGSLSMARSRIVGAVLPTLTGSAMSEQVQGMAETLRDVGYQLLLGDSGYSAEEESRIAMALFGWQPMGAILPSFVQDKEFRQRLVEQGHNVVEIGEVSGGKPVNHVVGISNAAAARAGVRHLLDAGKRKIAFVHLPVENNHRMKMRLSGYRRAIREAGLPDDASLIVAGRNNAEFGMEATGALLEREPTIDAIFFGSDLAAYGGISYCLRNGIDIPGRIAILGFGDIEWSAQTFPALSTVRVPWREMGRKSAEILLRSSETGERGAREQLPFQLVARETTSG